MQWCFSCSCQKLSRCWRWGTQGWLRRCAQLGHLTRDVTSQQNSALGRGKVRMQSPCLRHVVGQGTDTPVPLHAQLSLPSAVVFAVNLPLFLDPTTASYSVGACSTRAHQQPAPAPAPNVPPPALLLPGSLHGRRKHKEKLPWEQCISAPVLKVSQIDTTDLCISYRKLWI